MTNQEAFTKVATHLLTQRKKAYHQPDKSDGVGCKYAGAYRDENGHKCAIGILIPDHEYHPSFEGRIISDIDIRRAVPSLSGVEIGLLDDLQILHDYVDIELWEDELKELADAWEVVWEVPANVTLAYREAMKKSE